MIISYLCITKWIEAILDIPGKSMSHLIIIHKQHEFWTNCKAKLKIIYIHFKVKTFAMEDLD